MKLLTFGKNCSKKKLLMTLNLTKRKASEAFSFCTENGRAKTKKDLCVEKMNIYDSDYYFENGLRKVYPYDFTFHAFARFRWLGSRIIDVYREEFRAINPSKLEKRFEDGLIRVNDKIVSPYYILKNNDIITSQTHRHEEPVIGLPIKVVHEDDNVLIVDKPPSIPIHTCGTFHFNSLIQILRKEYGYTNLYLCHRIDRLVSGMVILAKSSERARHIIEDIKNRRVFKEYICKVEGVFPEGEIRLDKGIKPLCAKIGLQMVDEQGKDSLTVFNRISTDGKTSLVSCQPKTGRTHQIRLHLQYLGHPIIDDALYNSYDFGPNKGKGGDYGTKNLDEVVEKIMANHACTQFLKDSEYITGKLPQSSDNIDEDHVQQIKDLSELINNNISDEWRDHMTKKSFDASKYEVQPECERCIAKSREPKSSELFIHLHCKKYKGSDWEYETEMPFWAR